MQWYAFENVVCNMAVILFRAQYIDTRYDAEANNNDCSI